MDEQHSASAPIPRAPEPKPIASEPAQSNTVNVSSSPILPSSSVPPESPHHPRYGRGRKVVWAVFVFLTIAIIAAGALLWHNKHKPAKPVPLTKISVRLQWLHGAEFAGMYVAQDNGYYKAAGLEVDLKEYEDGVDINEEVASGQVDFGVNTPLEIVRGRNNSQNNKAIAAIYQINPYAIAARKESNINSPSDFRGKVLGSLGTNNEAKVTYQALLVSAGLTTADATIKGVDFDAVKVLKEHQADTADIYRTDQTFLLDQAHIAYNLIYPENFGLNSYGDILMTSDKKIKDSPEQVQAFVRATLKGWEYAVDHQDETLTILTRHENTYYKVPGYEKFVLSASAPLIRPTGGQRFGFMDYSIWNRIYISAESSGIVTTMMEMSDLYTSQFIK